MELLTALIIDLIVIAVLFEVARRANLPYPALFVLGGLALGFIPGLPSIHLEPELVLLVFLPPLLFVAAFETPQRDLRRNLWPIARLSIVLVVLTTVVVAAVAQALVPGLGWAAALALGAIVAPTDALAATSVFRRLGVPRVAITLIEGESLFNDATALIAYRAAVVATVTGVFVLSETLAAFLVAAAGGIALGWIVGRVVAEVVRWLDDPPVEVVVSLLIPWAAYLPAEQFELSGVLAVVTAGLVIGRRLGTILSPSSRVLWLTSWKMVGFVLNGLIFVLIGLALPDILEGLGECRRSACSASRSSCARSSSGSGLPTCSWPACCRTRHDGSWPSGTRGWPSRLTFLVAWSGLRGAVSLAAALALPTDFPERSLIQLLTFAVILATLVGQGLTLPFVVRWLRWTAWKQMATRHRSRGRRCTGSGSTRCDTPAIAGRTTCRCTIGWNRASATACSTSRPGTRTRPRSDAWSTRSTGRSSSTSSMPSVRPRSRCAMGARSTTRPSASSSASWTWKSCGWRPERNGDGSAGVWGQGGAADGSPCAPAVMIVLASAVWLVRRRRRPRRRRRAPVRVPARIPDHDRRGARPGPL